MEEDGTIRQEAMNNLDIQSDKNWLVFNSMQCKIMHHRDKFYNFCCFNVSAKEKRRTRGICLL